MPPEAPSLSGMEMAIQHNCIKRQRDARLSAFCTVRTAAVAGAMKTRLRLLRKIHVTLGMHVARRALVAVECRNLLMIAP
jgi:hypothetical protein